MVMVIQMDRWSPEPWFRARTLKNEMKFWIGFRANATDRHYELVLHDNENDNENLIFLFRIEPLPYRGPVWIQLLITSPRL